MDERSNRERAEKAFSDWHEGTGYITDLLARARKGLQHIAIPLSA